MANSFSNDHYHILRDIKEPNYSEGFRQLNFEPSSYLSSQGEILPTCEITKNGFSLLMIVFNGKKTMKFKVKLIVSSWI